MSIHQSSTTEHGLRIALRESLKLQSHYAMLLNGWDGGERMEFKTVDAWLARLHETKTLPDKITDTITIPRAELEELVSDLRFHSKECLEYGLKRVGEALEGTAAKFREKWLKP